LPLIGASIQLYAAGSSGSGSDGTALLSAPVTTDGNGSFTVPSAYPCPASTSQLYVLATGGKAGSIASSPNKAIALLTALGTCNQIAAFSQITVNEVTTVAGAYALNQFLSVGAKIGATETNTSGLQNAFAAAVALVDPTTGASPGPTFSTNGTSPAPLINTVANALDACAQDSSACASLFSATTPSVGPAPTNTLDAALTLVRNPTANVATLFILSSTSATFTPALTAPPSDWTLYIDYAGGGMKGPTGLGIDASGNVWVANYFNVASLFSPLGKPLFANGITGLGLSASYGLAVDASGNAWIPNEPNPPQPGNSISVLNSSGTSLAGAGGFTAGGLNYPIAVATDTDGSKWIVDYGNSHLTHLSNSGQALSGASGYGSSQLAFPVAVAIDTGRNLWIANQSAGTITKVSPDGSQFTSYTCCNAPSSLAIDHEGNVWVANYYGDSISEISASGTILSNGYTGGGLSSPQGIAVDGAGNLWIANYHRSSITEIAGAGASTPGASLSPAAGLAPHSALRESYAIAIDASGNLWVTNFGSSTLTEFIVLAIPVRTPLIGPPVLP
jgi:streptogramin lyase